MLGLLFISDKIFPLLLISSSMIFYDRKKALVFYKKYSTLWIKSLCTIARQQVLCSRIYFMNIKKNIWAQKQFNKFAIFLKGRTEVHFFVHLDIIWYLPPVQTQPCVTEAKYIYAWWKKNSGCMFRKKSQRCCSRRAPAKLRSLL